MDSKGCYSLILKVRKPIVIRVGALGYVKFDEGLYVYIGSALGSKAQNLENRIKRHFSRCKKIKWHIDFLLSDENVSIEKVIVCKTEDKVECLVVKELAKIGLYNPKIRGFGSSDCKSGCFSHLIYLGSSVTIEEAVMVVLDTYNKLFLKAEVVT